MNITTSGIDSTLLQEGQRLALGDQVALQITGRCAPCARRIRDPNGPAARC